MSEELMTKVQDLIENMINPAVAGHGGFVQLAVRAAEPPTSRSSRGSSG
jgi:Fe-S cluster biogenesis protein NfuA